MTAGPRRITGSTVIADLIPPLHSRQWSGGGLDLWLKKDSRLWIRPPKRKWWSAGIFIFFSPPKIPGKITPNFYIIIYLIYRELEKIGSYDGRENQSGKNN
jgi:hypothetical protein